MEMIPAAVNYASGASPMSVATGDPNLDGNPDLVASDLASNDLLVLLHAGLVRTP